MNRRLIEKAQSLLSEETGTVFKDPGGKITVALVYPNIYSVGMSSLGFQGVYGLLNSMSDVVCERAFLPDVRDIEEYERTGTELFSLETQRPLARYDIIAFSVSFENDYPNILKILSMSRIPLRSADRNDAYPLIIAGGVCMFYNPEPLAGYIDICFVGEAEEMIPEFLSAFRKSTTRHSLLANALTIDGVYIPRFYSVEYDGQGRIVKRTASEDAPAIIKKRVLSDISQSFPGTVITTPMAEFSDMYLLEAMRGCVWSCRFCVAGQMYRPPRKKDVHILRGAVEDALLRTTKVGLIGPSLTDYPHAEEVLSWEGVDFSITSLRASRRSGKIVQFLRGHKSVSIAPEAGSERLRSVINKKISEEDILETSKIILESGIETLRLYFMVGLPTETREDIDEIIELVKKIRDNVKRGFLTLSISTFVPKPFTPFQWHPMEMLKEVKERLRIIKKGLSRVKGVRVFHDIPKYAYLQGVFSLGDRTVASVVEESASIAMDKVRHRAADVNREFYIFREKGIEEVLPWDFIDAGIAKNELWTEYQKALSQ